MMPLYLGLTICTVLIVLRPMKILNHTQTNETDVAAYLCSFGLCGKTYEYILDACSKFIERAFKPRNDRYRRYS